MRRTTPGPRTAERGRCHRSYTLANLVTPNKARGHESRSGWGRGPRERHLALKPGCKQSADDSRAGLWDLDATAGPQRLRSLSNRTAPVYRPKNRSYLRTLRSTISHFQGRRPPHASMSADEVNVARMARLCSAPLVDPNMTHRSVAGWARVVVRPGQAASTWAGRSSRSMLSPSAGTARPFDLRLP